MIAVSPRAHSREDRAGDHLDGLVNLFDLGILLAPQITQKSMRIVLKGLGLAFPANCAVRGRTIRRLIGD